MTFDIADTLAPNSDQLEKWRPVVGFEGRCEVSGHGRVRSLDRVRSNGRKWREANPERAREIARAASRRYENKRRGAS